MAGGGGRSRWGEQHIRWGHHAGSTASDHAVNSESRVKCIRSTNAIHAHRNCIRLVTHNSCSTQNACALGQQLSTFSDSRVKMLLSCKSSLATLVRSVASIHIVGSPDFTHCRLPSVKEKLWKVILIHTRDSPVSRHDKVRHMNELAIRAIVLGRTAACRWWEASATA